VYKEKVRRLPPLLLLPITTTHCYSYYDHLPLKVAATEVVVVVVVVVVVIVLVIVIVAILGGGEED